jgi:hypothetical protein
VTTPLDSVASDDACPDETPEALAGIAERMQKAIEELFAVKAEAEELSKNAKLPDEVERVLTAAARHGHEQPPTDPSDAVAGSLDRRLYLPVPEGWVVRVKSGPREYCHYRIPGEDWFHLLIDGELFLQFGDEKVCLNCAIRRGILTDNRLFWQTGRRRQHRQRLDDTDNPGEEPAS